MKKIALIDRPQNYQLTILFLEVQPENLTCTFISPNAVNANDSKLRIKSGIEKLHGTTEKERLSLYEAAMIRYLSPEFNVMLKNRFPSTNQKILEDCYHKDFSEIIAEICADSLPIKLFSNRIEQGNHYHIAKFNLHKNLNRKVFLSINF